MEREKKKGEISDLAYDLELIDHGLPVVSGEVGIVVGLLGNLEGKGKKRGMNKTEENQKNM